MSVLCVCVQAGMQLAGTKRGRQDADSVGARRSAHRASTSSRARALSRQKHQDMEAKHDETEARPAMSEGKG